MEDGDNSTPKTTFSTRKTISDLTGQNIKGKKAFHKVSYAVGGFENARTVADLPGSYRQITDVNRKSRSNKTDELVELLDLCKSQSINKNIFIRDIRTAPEKTVFLATDGQLHDVERFCCRQNVFSVLDVDPTFNICDYNLTITTYKHPLLVNSGSDENPVMLGPSLFHSHKTFDSYFTLPSNIIRFCPGTKNLKAFGSDGEKNVFETFQACFMNANHLLCSIHMKDNVIKKCASLGIDSTVYIEQIFGKKVGSEKFKGLMDCQDDEFDSCYEQLKEQWMNQNGGPQFVAYFDSFKRTP